MTLIIGYNNIFNIIIIIKSIPIRFIISFTVNITINLFYFDKCPFDFITI